MAWLAELQGDLVAAAGRQRRRRVRRRRAAGAVVLLPLLLGVLLLVDGRGRAEASSVRVTSVAGGVEVALLDDGAPPRSVATDLADAGLVVQLEEATTGPSRVGRLLWLRTAGSASGGGRLFVPAGAVVRVGTGQAAPVGTPYDVPTDAFALGEPLHCLGGPGGRARDLAAALAAHGPLRVTWRDAGGATTALTADDERVVSSAQGLAAGVVEVFVGDDAVVGGTSCA